ncbi:hypothetical protein Tco_1205638, partial [Tanacetum coccineum]
DMEPSTTPVTDLSGTDANYQLDFKPLNITSMADIQALLGDDDLKKDSDNDVFEAGDDMDKDIQDPKTKENQTHHSTKHTTKEEHQSPSPNRDQPESLHANKTDASDSESSSLLEIQKVLIIYEISTIVP